MPIDSSEAAVGPLPPCCDGKSAEMAERTGVAAIWSNHRLQSRLRSCGDKRTVWRGRKRALRLGGHAEWGRLKAWAGRGAGGTAREEGLGGARTWQRIARWRFYCQDIVLVWLIRMRRVRRRLESRLYGENAGGGETSETMRTLSRPYKETRERLPGLGQGRRGRMATEES